MILARALFAALLLSMMGATSAVCEEPTVRMADPIFSPQIRSSVRKYGRPGLFFPEKADRDQFVSGIAVIECTLAANGLLTSCKLISETPPDYAFGDAALKMAEKRVLTAAPRIVDGQPVGGEVVRLAIEFGHPRH